VQGRSAVPHARVVPHERGTDLGRNRPLLMFALSVLAGGILLGCDPPGAGQPDTPPELEQEAPDEDDPIVEEGPDDVTGDTDDADTEG
jgi:hypothetical protein